jgi:hypothetical protein
MFSKMKQWLSKRQTPIGQLDQDGSLKANLISLSKEMTQITQDCRGVIDLSQPPAGYTKQDMDKLNSMFTELCKIENAQCNSTIMISSIACPLIVQGSIFIFQYRQKEDFNL